MLVDQRDPPIWRLVIKEKHLQFTLRRKRLLFAQEIKYMCMNTSPNVYERLKLLRFIGTFFFFNQMGL